MNCLRVREKIRISVWVHRWNGVYWIPLVFVARALVRAELLELRAACTFHSRASAHVLSGIRVAAAAREQDGNPRAAATPGIAQAAETLVEGALTAA